MVVDVLDFVRTLRLSSFIQNPYEAFFNTSDVHKRGQFGLREGPRM